MVIGKTWFIWLFLFFLNINAVSQKHDYNWITGYRGYNNFAGYDTASGHLFGHSFVDFNQNSRTITYDSLLMNFYTTNTSVSDTNGALIFYTNGIYIANELDETIAKSDSLNYGYYRDDFDPLFLRRNGYTSPQGIIAIPSVSNPQQYYLFHTLIDSIPGTFGLLMCRKLLYSIVDMSANAGHGEVVVINQELVTDSLGYPVAACRHANGRDWWILVQRFASNCFYRVLLDSTGAHLMPDMTCVGPEYNQTSIANACFSPDGSRYLFYTAFNELNLYRFNRCEGILYDAQSLYLTPSSDGLGYGASFSPNSRFLYASFTGRMCQFDLWESDIQGSIDTVGIYDGVPAPSTLAFHTEQLGPDGKIYIQCGNSSFVYHVIERPDEKGDSCMFTQRGLWFPNFSISIPTFPNYRLGVLAGPCDTIINNTEKVEKEKYINLYPNPATNYIIIDYGFTDWSKGDVTLEVINSIGQIMYQKQLPRYSGFHQVDVSRFASGLYTATIKRKGEVVATGRFVRE